MKSWSLFTMTTCVDSLFLWIFSGNCSFIKIARSQTEWSCCSSRSYIPVSCKLCFLSSWKWSRMENIQVLFCNTYQRQGTLNRSLFSDTSDNCKSYFSLVKLSPDSSFFVGSHGKWENYLKNSLKYFFLSCLSFWSVDFIFHLAFISLKPEASIPSWNMMKSLYIDT